MAIILIGGNPKGYSIPFHPSTVSGRRLRDMISKIGLTCEIVDMTLNSNDIPSNIEIGRLKEKCKNNTVVFLGRFVEKELHKHIPHGFYLPHPASRRIGDLEKLVQGLNSLLKESEK